MNDTIHMRIRPLGLCLVVSLLTMGFCALSLGQEIRTASTHQPIIALSGEMAHFNVSAQYDNLWGHDWPPNDTVTIKHGDSAELIGTADTDEWGNFWFDSPIAIQPGDLLEVECGDIVKTHIVTDLAITLADADNDTVSGTAAAGTWVYVGVHDINISRYVEVDAHGNWIADFSDSVGPDPWDDAYDLRAGDDGYANQVDEDGDATFVNWYVLQPRFNVVFRYNDIWGHEWPPHDTVTISFGNPASEIGTASTDDWGEFHFDSPVDIQPGDWVQVESGDIVKTHVVRDLVITAVDPGSNKVSGTAAPETSVHVSVHDVHVWRDVEVDEHGYWVADFSEAVGPRPQDEAYDLTVGDDGYARQEDEDRDATSVDWRIERPHFKVDPTTDHLWGHEWPVGETVTVTRVGEPDEFIGATVVNEWGDWWMDSPLDIQAHDLIRAESDSVLTEHVVTELQITEANPRDNIIRGTALPGTWVNVHVWDEHVGRDVEVDEHGEWLADFNEPAGDHYWGRSFDLQGGMQGGAGQQDEDGNETLVFWRAAWPHFNVDPNPNSLWGHDWPAGETVTIKVGDPVVFEDYAWVNGWGDWHLWDAPHDIQAGDLVRVECGEIVREHVVRDVQVVSVNVAANTVSGTAATGTWVHVGIYGSDISRNVETDANGFWLADFAVAGEEEWESTYNIEADTRGCACQFDEEDNATHIAWRPDRPILRVQPASHNFGHVDLNIAVTQVFEVANIGNMDLEIGLVELLDGHDLAQFMKLDDTVSNQTLPPDASGQVTVVFTPTNIWGKAVVLQIPSNDADDPVYEVRIYGTGRSETAAEERFEEGLAALADFMSEFGETSDFLTAHERFGEALAADPDHYGAAIFRLLTGIFALPYDEDIAQMLTDFGMPEEGRELWEWTAKLFEDEPVEELPYLDEVIHLAGDKIEALIQNSLENLGRIPAEWAGSVIFSPDHMPIDNEVQVDAGDVFMFRSGLSLLQGIICMVRAHDWHISFDDLDDEELQLSDHLATYPTLGALTNLSLFTEAAGWFVDAIDLYQVGSELIRNETDYQHDDLIVFDPDGLDDERVFRNSLSQVRDSLTGTSADPFEVELSQILDLDHFFHHPASLRDLLGGAGLQGALGSVILHQIDRALASLEPVGDAFAQTLMPEVDPVDRPVEMDHGDIWIARAWLQTWKALIHTAQAYEVDDVDVVAWGERDPFLLNEVFDDPETLALLTVKDDAALVAASNAVHAAISAYLSGSDFMRAHAATRANDVFAIWANELLLGSDRVAHDEAAFRSLLEDLQASMAEPVLIDYVNRKGEHAFFEVMHLGRLFAAPYVTREHAPEFDPDNQAMSGTFPDPTFNEIFPGMSQWHLADRLGLELEDTDGLGLPDLWQLHYFGDTGQDPNTVTPSGMSVGDAFRARTDPTDADSFLGLTDTFLPVPGDSVVEIRWQSMPYLYYAVESATNLVSEGWTVEWIGPATPYMNIFTDDSEDAFLKFYRIRLYD